MDEHGGFLSNFCKGCTILVWGCRICKFGCGSCKKEDYMPPGKASPTKSQQEPEEQSSKERPTPPSDQATTSQGSAASGPSNTCSTGGSSSNKDTAAKNVLTNNDLVRNIAGFRQRPDFEKGAAHAQIWAWLTDMENKILVIGLAKQWCDASKINTSPSGDGLSNLERQIICCVVLLCYR